jgi:hypothetical protein
MTDIGCTDRRSQDMAAEAGHGRRAQCAADRWFALPPQVGYPSTAVGCAYGADGTRTIFRKQLME